MSIPSLCLICMLCLFTAIQTQAKPNLAWLKDQDKKWCGNTTHYTCVHNFQCCRKVDELCDPNDKDSCVRQDSKNGKVSLEQCCDTVNLSLQLRMACDRLLFSDKEKSVKSQCAPQLDLLVPSTNTTLEQCCGTVGVNMSLGDKKTCARLIFSDQEKSVKAQCAPELVVPSTTLTLKQCCETAGVNMSLGNQITCAILLFSDKETTVASLCAPEQIDPATTTRKPTTSTAIPLATTITLKQCCETAGAHMSSEDWTICNKLFFFDEKKTMMSLCTSRRAITTTLKQCCETLGVALTLEIRLACNKLFLEQNKSVASLCMPEPVGPATNITLKTCCGSTGVNMSSEVKMECANLFYSNDKNDVASQCAPEKVDMIKVIYSVVIGTMGTIIIMLTIAFVLRRKTSEEVMKRDTVTVSVSRGAQIRGFMESQLLESLNNGFDVESESYTGYA